MAAWLFFKRLHRRETYEAEQRDGSMWGGGSFARLMILLSGSEEGWKIKHTDGRTFKLQYNVMVCRFDFVCFTSIPTK